MKNMTEAKQSLPNPTNGPTSATNEKMERKDNSDNAFNGILAIIAGAFLFLVGCMLALNANESISTAIGVLFTSVIMVIVGFYAMSKAVTQP